MINAEENSVITATSAPDRGVIIVPSLE